jgi:hypothetical protein
LTPRNRMSHTNYRTVKQLSEETKFTEGQIRWWIFHAKTNGLIKAIIKIGGRVFIDVTEFAKWLDSYRLAPAK